LFLCRARGNYFRMISADRMLCVMPHAKLKRPSFRDNARVLTGKKILKKQGTGDE